MKCIVVVFFFKSTGFNYLLSRRKTTLTLQHLLCVVHENYTPLWHHALPSVGWSGPPRLHGFMCLVGNKVHEFTQVCDQIKCVCPLIKDKDYM